MKKRTGFILMTALAFGVMFGVKQNAQAAVTNVTQTEASKDGVEVSFTETDDLNPNINRHYLELSTDKVNWTVMDTARGSGKITAGNLSSGKSYYARVGAASDYRYENDVLVVDKVGEPSEPIEIVTAPDNSSANVVQTKATSDGVTVQMTECSGANLYCAYNSGQISESPLGQSTSNTVTISKKFNPNSSNTIYMYACRKSSTGFVAYSSYCLKNVVTVTKKLTVKDFGVENVWCNIDTYWISPINHKGSSVGYELQLVTPSGKTVKTFSINPSYCPYFELKNVVNGHMYQYRMRSYYTCDNGKKSYSPWSDCKTIGVPKKVTWNHSKNGKSISVNWSSVKYATKYTVYASTKENSGFKKVKITTAKKRSLTLKKVGGKSIKSNQKYYIKIVPSAKVGKKTITCQTYLVSNYSFF